MIASIFKPIGNPQNHTCAININLVSRKRHYMASVLAYATDDIDGQHQNVQTEPPFRHTHFYREKSNKWQSVFVVFKVNHWLIQYDMISCVSWQHWYEPIITFRNTKCSMISDNYRAVYSKRSAKLIYIFFHLFNNIDINGLKKKRCSHIKFCIRACMRFCHISFHLIFSTYARARKVSFYQNVNISVKPVK